MNPNAILGSCLAALLFSSVFPVRAADTTIARWKHGEVTAEEYQRWRKAFDVQEDSPVAVREMIFYRELVRRALETGMANQPTIEAQITAVQNRYLNRVVQQHVRESITVDDAHVDALLRENPSAFSRPEEFQLSTIYRSGKGGDRDLKSERELLEELRAQLENGASFSELAGQHSDSQSRFKGGKVGYIALSALPEDVASALEEMKPGDITEVIEYGNGVGIFQLDGIREAKRPTPEEARQSIYNNLFRIEFKQQMESLTSRLTGESASDGTASESLSRIAQYARDNGWHATPDVAEELTRRANKVLANAVWTELIQNMDTAASDAEIAARYEQKKNRFKEPKAYRIHGVFFGDLNGADAESRLREASAAVEQRLAGGPIAALEESGSDVLGPVWLYPTQLSARDPILLRAVRQLKPGQNTGLIRLKSGLWYIEVLDFRPARQLTLEESADTIRKNMEEQKLQAAKLEKRAEVLASLNIVFVESASAEEINPQDEFFAAIGDLCHSRFEGLSVFPEDPGESFRDKTLIAHIASCSEDEIRIPFAVGNDTSRTWILRKTADGLELKHDHRHEDGTPDEITMYGGTAQTPGTSISQAFPADAHTAKLIPEAATNEWILSLENGAKTLVYYLERHGEPRFRAVLERVE